MLNHSNSYVCSHYLHRLKILRIWRNSVSVASSLIYNKLLRFVVISWFVRGKVDCGLLQIENVSDGDIVTDNDVEEVPLVDFPLTDEKEITKCNKTSKKI